MSSNPASAEGWMALGKAYHMLESSGEAGECLRKAQALGHPQAATLLRGL